ncbi:hypothetical protein AB0J83_06470 [Actinoplanes sp. NPDC049596]|uniref:hypothetical protein n=1 Tax=unclassified Actinoplanes TaxID=2626549 RepID=UPI003423AD34
MLALLLAATPTFGDGFEKPTVDGAYYRYAAGTQLGPWTVTRGDVNVASTSYWQVSEGRQNLGLDGAVAATFATEPLLTYRISWDLAGDPTAPPTVKTGELRVNDKVIQAMSFDTTGRTAATMGYLRRAAYVLAKGPSFRVEFAGAGTVIDDVRVDACLLIICPKGVSPAA